MQSIHRNPEPHCIADETGWCCESCGTITRSNFTYNCVGHTTNFVKASVFHNKEKQNSVGSPRGGSASRAPDRASGTLLSDDVRAWPIWNSMRTWTHPRDSWAAPLSDRGRRKTPLDLRNRRSTYQTVRSEYRLVDGSSDRPNSGSSDRPNSGSSHGSSHRPNNASIIRSNNRTSGEIYPSLFTPARRTSQAQPPLAGYPTYSWPTVNPGPGHPPFCAQKRDTFTSQPTIDGKPTPEPLVSTTPGRKKRSTSVRILVGILFLGFVFSIVAGGRTYRYASDLEKQLPPLPDNPAATLA